MNMKQSALSVFKQPPQKLNCAQSVLFGFQTVTNDKTIAIDSMMPFGGGRSPSGLCGALYAACAVAPNHDEEIKKQFETQLGSVYCHELRKQSAHPCETCVALASELLETATQSHA
jgi:hypothetical protein